MSSQGLFTATALLLGLTALAPEARADCDTSEPLADVLDCLADRISELDATASTQGTLIGQNTSNISINTTNIAALGDDLDANDDLTDSLDDFRAIIQPTLDSLASGQASIAIGVSRNADAIDAARADIVEGLSDYLRVDGATDSVIFEGANVYVQSGSGYTNDNSTIDAELESDGSGALTGLGNLIIGYDEGDAADKQSTHTLVVGPNHSRSSWGGLIAGYGNTVTGDSATVAGGYYNQAADSGAVVVGGLENMATGNQSVVVGGRNNTAHAHQSAIVSGRYNTIGDTIDNTIGHYAALVGGYMNEIGDGDSSVLVGGEGNYTETRNDVLVGD